MIPLMQAEFFKLRKRMMTWVVALILVGLIVLLYSVLWSVSGRVTTFGSEHQFTGEQLRRALFLSGSVPFSLEIVGTFGVLLAVVLAAGAVGSEYSWGTVRLVATASSGRLRTMGAKLIVVFGLVAAGTVLAIATALIYSSVITFTSGGSDFDFVTGAFIRDQFEALGRTLFVLVPYIGLAFGAAVAGRSTLAGAGAGIGVAFMEPLVGGLMRLGDEPWKTIPNYFINANAQVILLQNALPDALPRFGPGEHELTSRAANSPGVAAIVLVAYAAVFLALAFYLYRRRDITAD